MNLDPEISDITSNVFRSVLDLQAVPCDAADVGEPVCATVDITGAWQGSLRLECSLSLARRATSIMLAVDDPTAADVADALGEIANMVGGNVKTLLPAPSTLSVPYLRDASAPEDPPGSAAMARIHLAAEGHPFRVTLLKGAAIPADC